MNLLKRLRKITAFVLTLFFVSSTGILNILGVSAASSSASVVDQEFIKNYGNGKSVTINAYEDRSPYDVFGQAFGTDNPVEGATKTARQILGAEVERHVANMYDPELGKNVFKVEVNGNDCYTCYLHGTTYNSATGKFEGGNDDRQRIEIRPGAESTNWIGLENEITAFNWKLKIDKEITKPDGFFHIFQYKAYNSFGKVGNELPLHDSVNYPNFSSSEDGNPILTFTISSSAKQNLEFRYADIGTDAGQEVLSSIPLDSVKDRWLDITVKILNSESGWVTMVMKDALTGEVLREYNDPDRILDMWRRPEIKYNNQTFEGPYLAVKNMLNRPKWGIYRKADKSNPNVKDAKIYLADMTLYKSSTVASPVNLAYNKKAYNVGTVTGNAFQIANAKAERLTDGVQKDPVKYTSTTVPQNNFSALGDLSWIGTESTKKGNVVVDLGNPMSFNQIKLFAKTERLKYVNVSVSDDVYDHTEAEIKNIVFTPITKNGNTYFNENNNSGNDSADKEYLIDLGQTYTSRYVKFYFENGDGSNRTNSGSNPTFTMTGPPRLTELEVYNAPLTPQNVDVDYTSGSEATISWDQVPADKFIIYDGNNPLAESASNTYRLTNLDPGATYNLSVATVTTDTYSRKWMKSPKSKVQVLQTTGDPIIPNPPASVSATGISDKSITVNWETVADAESYRISLVTDALERVIADKYAGTSYTIKDLSPGTSYKAKVYSIRRGAPSTAAAEVQVTTTGIKFASDNLLHNKEVQYPRVWNDDTSSYGAHKALDNEEGSRFVAIKGSTTSWMMVDIGAISPVNVLEYYSFQNKLKKVSFYYATDSEAFTNPNSDKWIKILTDDRVAQGKYGNPSITKIAESIKLAEPVNARFIKFTVDEVDGDINVNEVKAFGPIAFTGNSSLQATEKTDTSIELSWAGSTTNMPVAGYDVYNGNTKLTSVTSGVYSYRATGLTPNTEYTFKVKAVSQSVYGSEHSALGELMLQATTLPAPGTDPVLLAPTGLAATPGNGQVTLSWNTVIGATYYNVKRSMTAGSAYTTIASNVPTNVFTNTGLMNGAKYYYVVTAVNADGESVNSNEVSATPNPPSRNRHGGGSGGGGSSVNTPGVQPTKDGAQFLNVEPVIEKASDGRTIARVTLDAVAVTKAIDALIANSSSAQKIIIEAKSGDATTAKFQLPAQQLADALIKLPMLIVSVKYGDVTYDLPIKAVDFAGLAKSLGVELKDLKITIMMEKVGDSTLTTIKDKAKQAGLTLLAGAVDFQITVEANGKSSAVNDFGLNYVTRTMSIGTLVDPKKATAVLYNPSNGELSFVPAIFTSANNATQVTIKRPGNSIYTIVESAKTFADLNGHWSKADVELLASKLVVKGTTDTSFTPDNRITRAEFAAILVRGLGLSESSGSKFTDVKANDWYAGVVGAAAKAGLVDGFEDGTFQPSASITREQMAVMVTRAMKLANKNAAADAKALDKFVDQHAISGWAKDAVAQSVNAGIINGMTDRTFVPAEHATRAEAAVMIKRYLQFAEMMN